ncbi:STAS domain-containing protein [Rossellomorea vietnamensis]|uniref:STAS domain-containing protein n=1 Tax=Rossellomorea aquimaris TaxID=189382 RepID=A0A5D4TKN0_9BACI|nr:STAS domain-containing protein [Rossellomorea aquimaris]TYS75438.1 STAS domain-containing protein [Rossellomorea aquimaris]
MSAKKNLSLYLLQNSSVLASRVVNDVLVKGQFKVPEQEKSAAITMYDTFLTFLGNIIEQDSEDVPSELIKWSKNNAQNQVTSQRNISEIVSRYGPTRDVFADLLLHLSDQFELSKKETVYILKRINQIFDISLDETVRAFEDIAEKHNKDMQKEVDLLFSPIVPIQKGIAVLPLIGKVDEDRASYLMNEVVPRISQMQLDYLIADFSGINHIDEVTAHHIQEIGSVLRLLGIKVITTGITPKLALTAVNSGIDLSRAVSFPNVKEALIKLNTL